MQGTHQESRETGHHASVLLLTFASVYALSICFETVVDVPIWKPYRIIGMMYVVAALLTVRMASDELSRTFLLYLVLGLIPGFMAFFESRYRRDDFFFATSILLFYGLVTYFAIVNSRFSRTQLKTIAAIHCVGMLIAALRILTESAELGSEIRAMGDFRNPAAACISLLFAGLIISNAVGSAALQRKLTASMALAIQLSIGVLICYVASLTGSRAGAAACAVGFGIYIIRSQGLRSLISIPVLCLLVAAVLYQLSSRSEELFGAALESNVLIQRIVDSDDSTDRWYLWRSGFDALIETWGLGVGLNRYSELHHEYFARYADRSNISWLDHDLSLHNEYVTALVEHGLVGLIVFLVFCRTLLTRALQLRNIQEQALALAVLAAMALNGWNHALIAFYNYWFYFALLVAWSNAERQEQALFVPYSR